MARVLSDDFGNASSVHHFGQRAKAVLDDARSLVAALIGAEPSEVVFTSGGTESDNFALRGVAEALEPTGRRHLIASSIEHEAVLDTLKALARRGWRDDPPSGRRHRHRRRRRRSRPRSPTTPRSSSRHAREQRDRHDPADCGARRVWPTGAARCSIPTPSSRSARSRSTSRRSASILLSLSAHKFNGPKGAGALWIKRGARVTAILTGGKHERSRRAGTENVPGDCRARRRRAACREEADSRGGARSRLCAIGSRRRSSRRCPGTAINGAREPRVPNTTNISFEAVEAESLLIALDLEGVAVSTGSACSSGTLEPSHVLRAMGLPSPRTQNSIRFSLGAGNTDAEVDFVVSKLPGLVDKLRSLTGAAGARADDADRGRHVGRRRLVGRCRAARRGRVTTSIGLSMQLYDPLGPRTGRRPRFGTCCTIDDLHDARRVAARIGIPHYIVNFERQFADTVIANFVQRVLGRPHADSVRALQRRSEVRHAGRRAPRGWARTSSRPGTTRASISIRRPAAIA